MAEIIPEGKSCCGLHGIFFDQDDVCSFCVPKPDTRKLTRTFLDNFHPRVVTNQLPHGEVKVICKNCMEYLPDCGCGPFMDPAMGIAEFVEKLVD